MPRALIRGSAAIPLLMSSLAGVTLASTPCAPGAQDHLFVGSYRSYNASVDLAPLDGVRARIRNKDISLCTETGSAGGATLIPADGDASVWVMMAAPSAGQVYAQVGYGRTAGDVAGTRAFYQFNDGSCATGYEQACNDPSHFSHQVFGSCCAYFEIGSSKTHRVSASSAGWDLFAAGYRLGTTPWDPDDIASAEQWEAQIFGETLDPGDDVPGTKSSRTLIDSVQIRNQGSGWNGAVGVTLSDYPYYRFDESGVVGGPTCVAWCFRIWTDRTEAMT